MNHTLGPVVNTAIDLLLRSLLSLCSRSAPLLFGPQDSPFIYYDETNASFYYVAFLLCTFAIVARIEKRDELRSLLPLKLGHSSPGSLYGISRSHISLYIFRSMNILEYLVKCPFHCDYA